MKRMFAIVLALMLCVSALSVVAFAAEGSASDYYLIGYINGADYGCNDDWENLGEYKFVNGKLTATFDQDSYIFVKTGDNANWYLTEAYCTDTTGTFVVGGSEKMFIPGGVEVTFTLTVNDGSVTVSYTTGGGNTTPTPDATDFYVAGTENLCGTGWKENDAANKMTKGDNGIYSITYSNLAAGSYEFKITDGTWDNSWGKDGGADNYVFEITEAQNITIKFDSNAKKPAAYDKDGNVLPKQEGGNTDPAPIGKDYYVAGCKELCGSEWKENDEANKMTLGADGTYSITYKNLPAGKYSFKVTDGTWTNSWGKNGSADNFEFEITEAQDITITFNPNSNRPQVITKDGKFGDVSMAAVSVALLAASAGLVAVVSKKKEF